jgi:hypothetical protein
MKIAADKIKMIPPQLGEGLCVYGAPSEEVQEWCFHNEVQQEKSGTFTNLILPKGSVVEELLVQPQPYRYLDGFSPNLNKHLHLGHLSNLVLAKAFQALGVSQETIAILGDTLTGQVSKEDALASFRAYCERFNYPVHHLFYASQMTYDGPMEDGVPGSVDYNGVARDYTGTKVFDIQGEKIVGLKGDGSTTYFYQDVALASQLNASTLYLTGSEQIQHFASLKKMFPAIDHVGLGLVLLNGLKMSSRNEDGSEKTEEEKKAIYVKDVLETLNEMFQDDLLTYNVLAGQILRTDPKSTKNINGATLGDPNNSVGLYISYTTARLKSAGVNVVCPDKFSSLSLGYAYVKSLQHKSTHTLFGALMNHCMKINSLYRDHRIADSPENKAMFSELMMDLELGLKKLGMFSVERVIRPDDGQDDS